MRKSAPFWLGLVVTALVALGLVVLSSASEANAIRLANGDAYFFMKRQCTFIGIGVALAVCVAAVDYRRWRDSPWLAWLFYLAVIALLLAVFRYDAVKGSQRWLPLGPVRLQPSELAKLAIVILAAVRLDRLGWKVELFWKGAVFQTALVGAIALPILMEPDFGSVMIVGAAGLLVMFVAGVRILHVLPFVVAGAALVAVRLLTNQNRVARLFDQRAEYQAKMALTAIGNGGVWGVGLGESMQKQLYLPEAHTDFVFAIGAEEMGLLFSVGAILLFCALFAISVYIARNAADRFGRLLVSGMTFILFFQAMFNIGVVCKALPTKGIALPFFSYGGTNLVCAFFAVGTIMSVGIHSARDGAKLLARKVLMRT